MACILAVSGIYSATRINRQEQLTQEGLRQAVLDVVVNGNSTVDTDGDGLKDWEEALWETDPANPDTDGDGTPDGEEVVSGRNPNVAGPDDAMTATETSTSTEDLTLTDKFARKTFGEYIALKGDGVLDSESEQALVDRLLQSQELSQEAKLYAITELDTTGPTDQTSVKAYGNALGRTLIDASPKNMQNELLILGGALQNQDPTQLAALDPIIEGYEKLIGAYVAMKAPNDAGLHHLNLVNTLSALLESIRSMRVVFDDPLRAYVGVSKYHSNINLMFASFNDLEVYFMKKGVTFEQGSDGYVFVNSL